MKPHNILCYMNNLCLRLLANTDITAALAAVTCKFVRLTL